MWLVLFGTLFVTEIFTGNFIFDYENKIHNLRCDMTDIGRTFGGLQSN